MTMDTEVEIDHVKLKDASARRNYDEKFFHFWLVFSGYGYILD
jgi:hypothetical protein